MHKVHSTKVVIIGQVVSEEIFLPNILFLGMAVIMVGRVGKNPGFMSIAQPSGQYWENPGFTGFYWAIPGNTGQYEILVFITCFVRLKHQ